MRLRLERFLFDQTYYRTYVYFKNILNLALYRFHFWKSAEVYFNGIASSAGKTFLITEGFNVMLIRAMGFVFTVVGGLFFFTRLLGVMMQKFRRHWALLLYTNRLLNAVRLSFWYHALVQYRFSIAGRFSGTMRAAKKILREGDLKLYTWSGIMDYAQADFATRWGIFGFSFWLQFYNFPELSMVRFMKKYRRLLRASVKVQMKARLAKRRRIRRVRRKRPKLLNFYAAFASNYIERFTNARKRRLYVLNAKEKLRIPTALLAGVSEISKARKGTSILSSYRDMRSPLQLVKSQLDTLYPWKTRRFIRTKHKGRLRRIVKMENAAILDRWMGRRPWRRGESFLEFLGWRLRGFRMPRGLITLRTRYTHKAYWLWRKRIGRVYRRKFRRFLKSLRIRWAKESLLGLNYPRPDQPFNLLYWCNRSSYSKLIIPKTRSLGIALKRRFHPTTRHNLARIPGRIPDKLPRKRPFYKRKRK